MSEAEAGNKLARWDALLGISAEREAVAKAVAEERAAVVTWLRQSRRIGPDDPFGQAWIHACMLLARDIERGEHRREEE